MFELKELFTLEMLNFAIVGAVVFSIAMFIGHFFDSHVPIGSAICLCVAWSAGIKICFELWGFIETVAFCVGGYVLMMLLWLFVAVPLEIILTNVKR